MGDPEYVAMFSRLSGNGNPAGENPRENDESRVVAEATNPASEVSGA
jgi:hypothetical protein